MWGNGVVLVIDMFVTLCCRCGVVAPFFIHFGTSFVWDFGLRSLGLWPSAFLEFGVRRSEFGSLEFGVWSLESERCKALLW